MSNYQPIWSISVIFKLNILLKVDLRSIYLQIPYFQLAYRKFHSTKAALLSAENDIICSMNNDKLSL